MSKSPFDSALWLAAFKNSREDADTSEQEFFRVNLESVRDKAAALVGRISADAPEFTVHDATHLDALWETASLVTSGMFDLNPPEAFVFGASVLLHDAGMTLAAYPNGLSDLKKTVEWADAVALRGYSLDSKLPHEIESEIKIYVIRRLHAEKAEELATQAWKLDVETSRTNEEFLISDEDLRRFYGPKIGLIAHSHGWSIGRVERELDFILGPMPPRTKCKVDLLKIACLLRVADALHLDRRRAPYFARRLVNPKGVSATHWTAQEKLAFPRIDDDAIVFTAGESFVKAEATGWWVIYDALAQADRELRDSDLLLREKRSASLAARRVKGANDPSDIARLIPVHGWRPIETRIKVSDIPKIVEALGGDKLYGKDGKVALRELIQNGMDAIQARRKLQNRPLAWGEINVQLKARSDGIWLSVEDNGVGMSETVLTGALLDFGTSFWRSSAATDEFPGLAAKGMHAVGRFGIGFFSIFMIGDKVRVVTRRYDRAESEGLVLEFDNGLASRPIVSKASPDEGPIDGGTRVEVNLFYDPSAGKGVWLKTKSEKNSSGDADYFSMSPRSFRTLSELVAHLAPASDVSINSIESAAASSSVIANDWKKISSRLLGQRASAHAIDKEHHKLVQSRVRELKDSVGTVYGRAALWPTSAVFQYGALTFGGIRIAPVGNIYGLVMGDVDVAARNSGKSMVPDHVLADWASEQATLIQQQDLDEEIKAQCADLILRYGGDVGDLPLIFWEGKWLDLEGIRARIKRAKAITVLDDVVSHDDEDDVSSSVFNRHFKLKDEIVHIPQVRNFYGDRTAKINNGIVSRTRDLFLSLVSEAWGDYEIETEFEVVGEAGGVEIIRGVEILTPPE